MMPSCRLPSLLVAFMLAAFSACGGSDNGSTSPIGSTDSSIVNASAALFINELQPSNKDTVTDEFGDGDDWIEIYNAQTTAVDLKGYIISDSGTKHTIPNSLPIPAGGFILLWADDSPGQGVAHLGFKLSAKSGDTVSLTSPTGAVVDTVSFGVARERESFARFPSGSGVLSWCAVPTPGLANGSACSVP